MHTVDVSASSRACSVGSTSTLPAGRRVDPNATRSAVSSDNSLGRPAEELGVLRVRLRVATFDPTHTEPVELFGDAQLVLDRQRDAFELRAVAQRRVEDVDRLGRAGGPAYIGFVSASAWSLIDVLQPVLVAIDLTTDSLGVLAGNSGGHGAGARQRAIVDRVDRARPRPRCRTRTSPRRCRRRYG